MSNDPLYEVFGRDLKGMSDLIKGMSEELKVVSRQLAQFEQKHMYQDEQSRENKAEIEKHDNRLTSLERNADRQVHCSCVIPQKSLAAGTAENSSL